MYNIRGVLHNLLLVGFVSSSMQLLLMREILNISGGYELISGTFLASWLMGSAAGAAVAGKYNLNDIKKINLIFALSPVVSISLLILLTRLLLTTGETPSFLHSVIYTFIALLPFCFVSGFTFVRLTLIAQKTNEFKPGRSFSTETIGGIIAGIIITSLTAGILNTYQLILIIIILNLFYIIQVFYIRSRRFRVFSWLPVVLLLTAIITLDPDTLFRQLLFPGIKIINSVDTQYGNISTGSYYGDQSIYYNQRLVSYNNDETEREENIHYAMLQHNKPEEILLVSGGLKSLLPEILKYPVKEVVYIERDPALIKTEGKYETSTGNTKITVENDDAYRYIKESKKRFDVIILLLPSPSTLSLNRFYTSDFFKKIKEKLNLNGVFLCSPGPGSNYFNKESINLYSSIFNSLKGSFENVEPVMGNKLYFISSDSYISTAICSLIEKRGINNIYVSPDYLSDNLIAIKSDEIKSLIDSGVKQNSLLHPVSYFQYLGLNISKDNTSKTAIIGLMTLLFILPALLIRRKNMIMYFTAAALAGIEVVILMMIQLTLGNIYHVTGLVIAALMAGLAAGAGSRQKKITAKSVNLNAIFLITFYLVAGMSIGQLLTIKNPSIVMLVSLFISFVPAFITGQIFRSLSDKMPVTCNIAGIYGADLAGSALGFIVVTGLLLPLTGLKVTVLLLSVFIFAGSAFGSLANK
jgi:spermidine synthase